MSGLLAAVRASQSVLPPRPFVSVTVTGLPGDAVVVLTVRLGDVDVDVGVAGGGVLDAVVPVLVVVDVVVGVVL